MLAVSAGNHAQGVAYHAQRLGVAATIVMPRFAPAVKVENTRRFGADRGAAGDTFDDARAARPAAGAKRGLTLVHPYDDLAVMAGQGTIALEMLAAQPDIDTLVVAVGGGGLISGIASAARALRPGIQVFGVQTERFPPVWSALHGEPRDAAGHHRRRHRRQVAGRVDPAADPRACRRRAAGRRRRHRAGASCCCWRSRRRWSKAPAPSAWPRC